MSYSSTILAESGLIAYWPSTEASGTTLAESAGGRAATLGGGYTHAQPGATAGLGGSMAYNGTSGYAEVATASALHPTAQLSLEAWFRLDSLPSDHKTIAGCGNSSPAAPYLDYELKINSDNTVGIALSLGSTFYQVYTPLAVSAATWYHVAVTYNGSSIFVFLNGPGVAQSAIGAGTIRNSGQPFAIARYNRGGTVGGYFPGRIAHVALYSLALGTEWAAHVAAASASTFRPWSAERNQTIGAY